MVELRRASCDEDPLPEAPREWLVANGLGGYASATVTGAITRRYHGFLIAAQPAPLGRMVVLNDLEVDIELEDGSVVNLREKGRFLDFTLNMGLPSWRYELDGVVIEKSIVVPSRQNIVHSTFRSLGDSRRVRLRLRPLINFRALEAPVDESLSSGYTLTVRGDRYEISAGPDLPILRLAVEGAEGPTFTADGARARAEGDEVRTVIAGYHWFTDWGRDSMISLEGLTLATGRAIEARWILRTFAHYMRDGLIPNMFPEGQNQGLYNTADATLWFFHALHRYVQHSRDKATLELLLPILKDIVRHHLAGTRFGIKVDPLDGLLTQGAEGYALTWMDAKVGDWVVTPRRGKAVEINALWYNALRLLADWLRDAHDSEADDLAALADKTRDSFNRRFC